MADSIGPGPCSGHGCPEPTEIDCILVQKVYASCSQNVSATITFHEDGCHPPYTCSVNTDASTCTVGAVTSTSTDDYHNITFVVTAVMNITCANGKVVTRSAFTTVTVPLYNPEGTTPSCGIVSANCSAVALPNGHVVATANLCLLLQTTAPVQILVPTFGFCTPTPCEVAAVTPCPPSPLFPPQLT